MKKVVKCVLALAMSGVMLLTSACGAGGENKGDAEKTLHVAAINKGYGIEWLENMLDEFCDSKGWDYVVYPVYTDDELIQKIEAGKEACNYDLVFAGTAEVADEKYLLELSEVLNSSIETGERAGRKISECMDPSVYSVLQSENEEGKYYRMPWTGGVNGLLYNNAAIVDALGADWMAKYPCRTTEELLELCAALKKEGLAPFIHSADTNYYSYLYEAWFAQYNGTEGMSNYFNALYRDFLGEQVTGYDVARNNGVLESAKVMESIFANGNSHERSNSIDWEVTQTLFMSGEAAMFSNGDWNNVEMMKQFPDNDVRFMKVPMISALGTKLGITDKQLASVVDYIDGKEENPGTSNSEYTNEQIIQIVTDARRWVASYVDMFNVSIPEYSQNAEMAKEFLKFMVSDVGQHIFSETTGGLTMCYGYDLSKDEIYSGLSEFAKSRWEIAKNAQFYTASRAEAYSKAGLFPFQARTKAPLEVLMSRTEDRYSAQKIYDYDYDYFKTNWNLIVNKLK